MGTVMTTIKAALDDLLNNRDLELGEAVDRHFAAGYRQRTNGDWDDRNAFITHIAHLRSIVASAQVTVAEEIIDTDRYAERHIVEVTKTDGSRIVQEVYVFGDLDTDGRFTRIEETTLMLAGAEADRGIGNAR